jgi:hypothetical protein
MKIRDAIAARLHELLEHVAEGKPLEDWMIPVARKALPAFQRRAPVKKAPIPSQEFVDERRAREDARLAAETVRIRKACVARAREHGWVGELCGNPLPSADEAEMCHLDGGSGNRRQQQWVGNCLMEHRECHQGPLGIDKKPIAWAPAVRAWAARYGYRVPDRFRVIEALKGRRGTP